MTKTNYRKINKKEFDNILYNEEGDYSDFVSAVVGGARIQEKVVGFANSEGGNLFVGIKDKQEDTRLDGFETVEDASKVIDAAYRDINPRINNLEHEFLMYEKRIIAKLIIPSSTKTHKTASNKVIVRKGAKNIVIEGEDIKILKYKKGVDRYEDDIKNVDMSLFYTSKYFKGFLSRINFSGSCEEYLMRNNFIFNKKPRISAILCFLDVPQTVIKSGIRIIRYEHQKYSRMQAYSRERVSNNDCMVEGPIELLIRDGINKIDEMMPAHSRYPKEAILEVLANAVLHRDYYVQNEIQIKIYDNRIEIVSPGGFAGGVTSKNIFSCERFCRNPSLVRALFLVSALEENKKDRLNQNMGEGIKTIVNSMRKVGLANPIFQEKDNTVIVVLKHANVESYERKIIEYLQKNSSIANREAREITGEEDKEKIKNIFKKLIKRGVIEIVDVHVSKSKIRYKLKGSCGSEAQGSSQLPLGLK